MQYRFKNKYFVSVERNIMQRFWNLVALTLSVSRLLVAVLLLRWEANDGNATERVNCKKIR